MQLLCYNLGEEVEHKESLRKFEMVQIDHSLEIEARWKASVLLVLLELEQEVVHML